MADRWSLDEELDELELDDDFVGLAEVGRGRKAKKKTPARVNHEFAVEAREDKRRKRRWEAPPHKRISDYDPE